NCCLPQQLEYHAGQYEAISRGSHAPLRRYAGRVCRLAALGELTTKFRNRFCDLPAEACRNPSGGPCLCGVGPIVYGSSDSPEAEGRSCVAHRAPALSPPSLAATRT